MKLNNIFPIAAVAAASLMGSCDQTVTQQKCDEVLPGSKLVGRACLDNKYADLEELRKKCGGLVVAAMKSGEYEYGTTHAPVWTCAPE